MIQYMTKRRALFSALILFLVVNGIVATMFSLVMSELINCATGERKELVSALLVGVFYVIAYNLIAVGYSYVKAYNIAEARKNLKKDLFQRIYFRSMTEFEGGSSAEYINELSNNVNILEDTYFRNIVHLGEMIVSFLSASLICVAVQPIMLLVMMVLALITLGITKITTKPLEQSMGEYSKSMEEYTAEIKDDFSGFGIIHIFHAIDAVVNKHQKKNIQVEAAKRRSENCRILCAYSGNFIGLLSTVLVMAAAAYFSQKGMFSSGMIIAFGSLIGSIVSPVTSIPSVIADFHASKPVRERFKKILGDGQPQEISGAALPEGDLVMEHVTFGYGEKQVLNDCTCRFEKGKHYVLLGSSGAGKSSLLNLLAGVYQNYTGRISVKGVDLKEVDRKNMADSVTMVKQDTFLFNDTIRNNITLFCDGYSEQDLENVIGRTGLKNLIASLPDGLETMIQENGSNFSGGEKQRIGLARALLRSSRILLLDEFTANLDPETARELEDNILKQRDKTIITVTHQREREKLEKYDSTIVLNAGKIEQMA